MFLLINLRDVELNAVKCYESVFCELTSKLSAAQLQESMEALKTWGDYTVSGRSPMVSEGFEFVFLGSSAQLAYNGVLVSVGLEVRGLERIDRSLPSHRECFLFFVRQNEGLVPLIYSWGPGDNLRCKWYSRPQWSRARGEGGGL